MKIDIYAKNYEVGEKLKNVTEQKSAFFEEKFLTVSIHRYGRAFLEFPT